MFLLGSGFFRDMPDLRTRSFLWVETRSLHGGRAEGRTRSQCAEERRTWQSKETACLTLVLQ